MTKIRLPRSAWLCAVAVAPTLCAAVEPSFSPGQIANETLAVRYDAATHTFSVIDRADNKAFVKDGRLDDAGPILREEKTTDPVFGEGRRILIARNGGGGIALEVYSGLPFALVREVIKNDRPTPLDLAHAVPATFTLDLGKPASGLKTLGTGGLLPADQNPGSYWFLTAADPATRNGVVAGWLTQDRGSGVVFSSVKGQGDGANVEFKAQIDYGHLSIPAGQSAKLETLAIGRFTDARLGLEAFGDAVKKQYAIKLRKPDAVYMTWYAEGPGHGGAGNETNTVEMSRFIAKELKPYGLGVIQIDDEWQDGPTLVGPRRGFDRVKPNGGYPRGITPVAKELAKDGITLGLWWTPFGFNYQDPAWKNRRDWFAKRQDGKPYDTPWGGTCLDLTHPDARKYVETLAKAIRSWGVTYYKMDAFSTGAVCNPCYINDGYKDDKFGDNLPLHDPGVTNIEAMRGGIKLIRKAAGDDVFFSGCAMSQNMRMMAGSIGLVDAMRVGPDFNHDGQGLKTGPLRASRLYFMNGRIWWNDPDPSKVRSSAEATVPDGSATGAVSLQQARLTTSYVSLSGQFFLVSDWLPNLPKERLDVLKRTLSHHEGTARPVDTFDRALPNTWLTTDDKSGVRRAVIGAFNFDTAPVTINHTLAKLGLDPEKSYHAFDFWANAPVADLKAEFNTSIPPAACRVISVREVEDHPVLVSTSRHVSSGILEVKKEQWSDNALSGVSEVIANDPYELRITGLRDGGKQWEPSAADLSPADVAAGVKVSQVLEGSVLRVRILSPVAREIKWHVAFKPGLLEPEKVAALTAVAKSPDQPVLLKWEGNGSFHTITRDGEVVARGWPGLSYADASASRGKTHAYVVAIEGGAATPPVSVEVPAFPAPPALPDVKVDGLKPLSAKSGYAEVRFGKAVDGGPLTVGGKTCDAGIGLHAMGEVIYTREKDWKRFVANIGLNESQRAVSATSLICTVTAENAAGAKQELAASPLMGFGGVEEFPVDVELPADCARIHLSVEDGGDGIRCDHANWGNAGFMK